MLDYIGFRKLIKDFLVVVYNLFVKKVMKQHFKVIRRKVDEINKKEIVGIKVWLEIVIFIEIWRDQIVVIENLAVISYILILELIVIVIKDWILDGKVEIDNSKEVKVIKVLVIVEIC